MIYFLISLYFLGGTLMHWMVFDGLSDCDPKIYKWLAIVFWPIVVVIMFCADLYDYFSRFNKML